MSLREWCFADELENELEDGNSPMQGSRQPITGGSSSTRGTNTSTAGSPGSLSEAAQRREQERDAAYHASTGGMSQGNKSRP